MAPKAPAPIADPAADLAPAPDLAADPATDLVPLYPEAEGATALSHAGVEYAVAADGSVLVPLAEVESLLGSGLVRLKASKLSL